MHVASAEKISPCERAFEAQWLLDALVHNCALATVNTTVTLHLTLIRDRPAQCLIYLSSVKCSVCFCCVILYICCDPCTQSGSVCILSAVCCRFSFDRDKWIHQGHPMASRCTFWAIMELCWCVAVSVEQCFEFTCQHLRAHTVSNYRQDTSRAFVML